MVDNIDHLGHDSLTDIVGLLWVVSYAGICRVINKTYKITPSGERKSISIGIGAISMATSTPNWMLCRIVREGTSWVNDAWQWWWKNRRKRSGR
jgi:hypothetical protein